MYYSDINSGDVPLDVYFMNYLNFIYENYPNEFSDMENCIKTRTFQKEFMTYNSITEDEKSRIQLLNNSICHDRINNIPILSCKKTLIILRMIIF